MDRNNELSDLANSTKFRITTDNNTRGKNNKESLISLKINIEIPKEIKPNNNVVITMFAEVTLDQALDSIKSCLTLLK